MPTQSLLQRMRKKYKLEDFTQENIDKLLFDKHLTVPNIASAVQMQERPRPTVANLYNTVALHKSKEKKIVDKVEQLWEPQMQVHKTAPSKQVSSF